MQTYIYATTMRIMLMIMTIFALGVCIFLQWLQHTSGPTDRRTDGQMAEVDFMHL